MTPASSHPPGAVAHTTAARQSGTVQQYFLYWVWFGEESVSSLRHLWKPVITVMHRHCAWLTNRGPSATQGPFVACFCKLGVATERKVPFAIANLHKPRCLG